ncbi:MAG: hypothetical protein IJV72_02455, partial [Clostridia bacterium]|nr:hypothetical protein [Clostridia bacterium]
FDGNGHTVSGLYCNENMTCVGFFGCAKSAQVKNLGIVDSYFKNTCDGYAYTGSIVGYLIGTIYNCYNMGTVEVDCGVSTKNINLYVGGIGGHLFSGSSVENCYNTGSVSAKAINGGYTCINLGGIVGYYSSELIKNCYNIGNVTNYGISNYRSNYKERTGGIVGYAHKVDMMSCFNKGTITESNTENTKNTGSLVGYVDGGITFSNSFYLDTSETDSYDGTTFKSSEQFASGEVCLAVGYHIGSEVAKGFCDICTYQSATLNADGYYEISNAGQLFWFARQVNIEGDTDACAKLTADIDLENRRWYPIGVYNDAVNDKGDIKNAVYSGTIDGNNHTISNFRAIGSGSQGLVGYSSNATLIKNLGVVNATVKGWNAGAVLGYWGTVENCYAIDCTATAYTDSAEAKKVYAGAIAGAQAPTVKNSFAYNCEVVLGAGMESKQITEIAPIGGETAKNSYYFNVTATNSSFRTENGEIEMTEAQFASGEVAYLLNGLSSENVVWHQSLGADSLPTLSGTAVVYKNQLGGCTDDSYAYEYSNTKKDAVTTHDMTEVACMEHATCKRECGYTDSEALAHDMAEATCLAPATCKRGCGHTEGDALGHLDANTDHICDRKCGKSDIAMEEHIDKNNDHACDYGCSVMIGEHSDGDNDGKCDSCEYQNSTNAPDAETAATESDKGCGSSIGFSAFAVVSIIGAAFALKKKKSE